MTNFERITETPEKAAEFFDKMLDEIKELDGDCYFVHRTGCKKDNCIECIIEWLKRETEPEAKPEFHIDLPKVSIRSVNKPSQETSETVHKVIADMEYKFEIGAIIALLRKLLMATWDYNIAHRKHIGVLVEDVLNFLIEAMEAELEKEEKEDENVSAEV